MNWSQFHQTPWRTQPVYEGKWASNPPPPAMLSKREKEMLYWLSANAYTGDGWIVDAGCFLGGSTIALGTGLSDNKSIEKKPHIVSYDLFVTPKDPYTRGILGSQFEMGDSFRHLYDEYTSRISEYVIIDAGNFKLKQWEREPIDLLFIDIAKCWETNQTLINEFFPALEVGSCLIQQDYRTPYVPWVHLTMELMKDYFELIHSEGSSLIYKVSKKPIHNDLFDNLRYRLTLKDKIHLMESAINRNPEVTHLIEGSTAMLIFMESTPEEAFEYLNVKKSQYKDSKIISMWDDVEKMFQVWITGDALENEMNTKFERYAR